MKLFPQKSIRIFAVACPHAIPRIPRRHCRPKKKGLEVQKPNLSGFAKQKRRDATGVGKFAT